MRVATEGKITVCGTVTGSVELEQARDVRDTLDGARASNLVVENETAVLEHAVGYLSLPGHTDETASRVMPLAMQERNEVVDELIKEALELQMKPDPESAVATFMPSKKRLITGVLPGERRNQNDVPRAKRRK